MWVSLNTATEVSTHLQVSTTASEDQAKLNEELKCLGRQKGEQVPKGQLSLWDSPCISKDESTGGVSYCDQRSPGQLCACMCMTACTSNWHWLVCPGASNGKTGIQGQQLSRQSVF